MSGTYSSDEETVPTTGSVSTPTKEDVDVSDLSDVGWGSHGFSAAPTSTTISANPQSSITLTLGSNHYYYTVYTRTLTAYSGLNKATTHTGAQYYTTSGNFSSWNLSDLTASTTGLSTYDWDHAGWVDGTKASSAETSSNIITSYGPPVMTKPSSTICAVYSRQITAISGGTSKTTHKGLQYYNSCGGASNVTELEFPTADSQGSPGSPGDFTVSGSSYKVSTTGLSGWTFNGFKTDSTGSVKTAYQPVANVTPATSYAAYSISNKVYFYYGTSKSTYKYKTLSDTYTSDETTVPTTGSVTTPTYSEVNTLTTYGWTAQGFRSNVPTDKTTNPGIGIRCTSTSCSSSTPDLTLGSDHYYYTVYSREVTATSGFETSTTHKGIQYYVTSGITSDLTLPTADSTGEFTVTDYSSVVSTNYGFGHLGWRDDGDAAASEYSICQPGVSESKTYYAVYSREVKVYSGIHKNTEHKATEYYNSSGNYGDITMPTEDSSGGFDKKVEDLSTSLGWHHIGWMYAADQLYAYWDTNAEYPGSGGTYEFYAIYERILTAKSGLNGATTHTGKQLYNSGAYESFVSSLTLPTTESSEDFNIEDKKVSNISSWRHLSWRTTSSPGANNMTIYQPWANVEPDTIYAVYSRTVAAKSGIYNSTTYGYTTHTGTQYYNSGGDATNVSHLDFPTTSSTGDFTDTDDTVATGTTGSPEAFSWSHAGWRLNTTAGASEKTVYDVPATTTGTAWAIYTRDLYAVSGINSGTVHGGTQYYNSRGNVSSLALPTGDSSGGFNNLGLNYTLNTNNLSSNGWTHLGWRADKQLSSVSYATNDSYVPSATSQPSTLYAIFTRFLVAYSGTNRATEHRGVQYYNSGGVASSVSSLFLPSTSSNGNYQVDGYSSLVSTSDPSGWTHLGWRTDTTATSAYYGTLASYGPAANQSASPLYAVYDRAFTLSSITPGSISYAGSVSKKQYYNSGGNSYSVSISNADAADLTANGWVFRGWTESTTNIENLDLGAADTEYTGSSNSLWANYYRDVVFEWGLYYNSTRDTANVTQFAGGYGYCYTNEPSSSDYDFSISSYWLHLGWRDDTTVAANENITSSCSNKFYASYSRTISIGYDKNGGNYGPSSNTIKTIYLVSNNSSYILSSSVTISSIQPTHASKVFVGYNTNKSATTSIVSPGGNYSISGSAHFDANWIITLYAIWK